MMRFLQSCVYSLNIMIFFRAKYDNEKARRIISLLLIPAGIVRYIYVSIKAHLCADSPDKCAIVTIVKNEERYIQEFLEFYRALGCELIIYDNDSTDGTASIVKQFQDSVEYIHWPGKKRQLDAYNHAVKQYANRYKYMMFFDADEFLVADKLLEGKSLLDILNDFFAGIKANACLGINWLIFGSSGLIEYPCNGVVDSFMYSAEEDFEWNQLVKSCVIPRRIVGWGDPHLPLEALGYNKVNLDGRKIVKPRNDVPARKDIRLYHYFVKNKKHFQEKVDKGMADRSTKRSMDEFYYYDKNDVYNHKAVEIRDYVYSHKIHQ